MRKHTFKFKQFSIQQDNCAMKIGTDGVLLGAWTSIKNNPTSILDIGTGTGVIALQLAQRSTANIIDALEIDNGAYEQAVENFENSPWGDRLFCYHATLKDFAYEIDEKYDLIVSNPPFYSNALGTDDISRNKARHTSSLSFESLINCSSKLLSKEGVFSIIIPFSEEENFITLAEKNNLFPSRICRVKGNTTSKAKRSLIEFSFERNDIKESCLIIEKERHQYTDDYIEIVKDFYIKM